MSIATAPAPTIPLQERSRAPNGHVVMENISWETYRRLREESEGQHLKMTFDRGRLEIMPPRPMHSLATRFLDITITTLCRELGIRLSGYRDTTWQREIADRGLEADECYYIQNAALADARGPDIDLERDPPPDLAVETDVTHSSVDKEAVYAAIGVPELWRWDNGRIRIRLLSSEGVYEDAQRSRALPMFPPEIAERFVRLRISGGETPASEAFTAWVRQTFPKPSH